MSESKRSDKVPPGGFQAPKGTRDFYPREMLLRRYITDAWRRTALRHGFDEIDGPTFENASLYTVKSGEGILSELFSFTREGGDDLYALRPEFTPTLARMYAARAKQLPQPTKWFCVPSFFRAERPQRGRLREFFQWNCDIIGGEDAAGGDVETISVAIELFLGLGLSAVDLSVLVNDKAMMCSALRSIGVTVENIDTALRLIDRRDKISIEQFNIEAGPLALNLPRLVQALDLVGATLSEFGQSGRVSGHAIEILSRGGLEAGPIVALWKYASMAGLKQFLHFQSDLARGLAYYTGTVFEVIAEGERAVAGGGRYDNLIELFGGPPTPACGFGMGDVVLGNLLADKELVPEGRELVEALSRPMPVRPDVFVVASPNEKCDEAVVPLVARLRRGVESEKYRQGDPSVRPWSPERYDIAPLHARRSYKSTKNVGKLLADAGACFARFAAIIESVEDVAALEGRATVKNLDTGEQVQGVAMKDVGKRVAM